MEITTNSSLAETLNAFIADEHLAAIQYKMAKVVAKGKALNFADKVFHDNGDEEDEHFDELVEYAQSLNIPVQVNPSQIEANCTTPFVDVTDGDSTAQLVSILISAEKRAIEGYETALKNTGIISDHPELTQFFGEILNDERGHLKELEDVKSNIDGDNGVEQTEQPNVIDVVPPPHIATDAYGYELNSDEMTSNNAGIGESSERKITASLVESIKNESIDSTNLVRNLLNYIDEDSVAKFADDYNYFDSETARSTSVHESRQCSNMFMELIEDGMVEPKILAADILDSMDESEVKEFAEDLGYIGSSPVEKSEVKPMVLGESAFSFQEIFNKAVIK